MPLAGFDLSMLWKSFLLSDPMGQLIVVGLIGLSIWAWTIIGTKRSELRAIEREDEQFMKDFQSQRRVLELYVKGRSNGENPLAKLYLAACLATEREFANRARREGRAADELDLASERLDEAQMASIQGMIECEVADQTALLDTNLSTLVSIYSLAPMAGLFGTVWGIMVAFAAMGQDGTVNLSSVAPGVSSALLTTVIGLVVAIPSALGSNYLNAKLSFLTMQLENFPAKFAARLQQDYLYE